MIANRYILYHRRNKGMEWKEWGGPFEKQETAQKMARKAQTAYPSYEFQIRRIPVREWGA